MHSIPQQRIRVLLALTKICFTSYPGVGYPRQVSMSLCLFEPGHQNSSVIPPHSWEKTNGRMHHRTKKVPAEVFAQERRNLLPVSQKIQTESVPSIARRGRKDNTIVFRPVTRAAWDLHRPWHVRQDPNHIRSSVDRVRLGKFPMPRADPIRSALDVS